MLKSQVSITLQTEKAGSHYRWHLYAERILMVLPLTLFFPVGFVYSGVLLFYVAWSLSGSWSQKWSNLKQHPMTIPVLALSLVTSVVGIFYGKPAGAEKEFWPGFGHYQTYLFLLPMLSMAAGEWQKKTLKIFFAGAILAASLFILGFFQVLPENTFFHSYVRYLGNKSILLGILLSIAAGWMMHHIRIQTGPRWYQLIALLYVVGAMVFLSKTRTALVIFVCIAILMACRNLCWNWRSIFLPFVVGIAGFGLWTYSITQPHPATCVINDVQASPVEKLRLRTICTIQQINDLRHGRHAADDDGMRTEIYTITSGIIKEQPWMGHGIASWMPLYRERSEGLSSHTMTTPHSDYLLYLTETGLIGLVAMLMVYAQQWRIAYLMSRSNDAEIRDRAMLLAMLTLAMMIGAAFNAILRDGVFAMAFMVLLAIPLAGIRKTNS